MKTCCKETFKLAFQQVVDLIEREKIAKNNMQMDQLLAALQYAISELEKKGA